MRVEARARSAYHQYHASLMVLNHNPFPPFTMMLSKSTDPYQNRSRRLQLTHPDTLPHSAHANTSRFLFAILS